MAETEKKNFWQRLTSFKTLGRVAAIGAGVFASGFAASLIAFAPVSTAFATGLTAVTSAVSFAGLGVAGLGVAGLGVKGAVTGISKLVNAIRNRGSKTNTNNRQKVNEQENRMTRSNKTNRDMHRVYARSDESVMDILADPMVESKKAMGLYDYLGKEGKADYDDKAKVNPETFFNGKTDEDIEQLYMKAQDLLYKAEEKIKKGEELTAVEQKNLAMAVIITEKASALKIMRENEERLIAQQNEEKKKKPSTGR